MQRCYIDSLQPYTQYYFRVAAENAMGVGPYSDSLIVHTAKHSPADPRPPQVVKIGSRSATASWIYPDDHGDVIIHSEVQLLSENDESYFEYQTVYKGPENLCCIAGLKPSHSYSIRVMCANNVGHSKWSDTFSFQTKPDVPGPVSKVHVVRSSSHSLSLNWSSPITNGSNVIAFQIFCQRKLEETEQKKIDAQENVLDESSVTSSPPKKRRNLEKKSARKPERKSPKSSKKSTKWKPKASYFRCSYQPSDLNPFEIQNLGDLTDYIIKCRAINSVGNGFWSESIPATTALSIPPRPEAPVMKSCLSNYIEVEWKPTRHSKSYLLEMCREHSQFEEIYRALLLHLISAFMTFVGVLVSGYYILSPKTQHVLDYGSLPYSPLVFAAKHGKTKIVKHLYKQFPQPLNHTDTQHLAYAFQFACAFGQIEIVQYFVTVIHRRDVYDIFRTDNDKPFRLSLWAGHSHITDFLLMISTKNDFHLMMQYAHILAKPNMMELPQKLHDFHGSTKLAYLTRNLINNGFLRWKIL